MKITIEEKNTNDDVEIIIRHHKSQDIQKILDYLENQEMTLICKKEKEIYQISCQDIYYIESIDEKTFVYLDDDVYENNYKLYELENMLEQDKFIRISKSTLLNIDYLDHVRALLNGKYEATLMNHEKVIISRKYMTNFKKAFGM